MIGQLPDLVVVERVGEGVHVVEKGHWMILNQLARRPSQSVVE